MTVREFITVGEGAMVISESAVEPLTSFFEDDGETGYFYALDSREDEQILDALHIYNVESVVDRHRESEIEIIWSADALKSMLLINGQPHAVFDFSARRGYCRTGFPNFPQSSSDWQRYRHEWDDSVVAFFDLANRS
ncbi:MAG TPA: DUF2251 domain-containing protein [Bryobacteraceae bacterium]|nr:DUF2251 domain-containing protein [Bryobacteraceae bacterium]